MFSELDENDDFRNLKIFFYVNHAESNLLKNDHNENFEKIYVRPESPPAVENSPFEISTKEDILYNNYFLDKLYNIFNTSYYRAKLVE